jgi:deoxyribodipyrimidine photo-lyase
MKKEIAIVWFRQDLRLHDNPALIAVHETQRQILPLYILDESAGEWKMGGASRWWLHQSLLSLNKSLDGHLCLQKGNALAVLLEIIAQHDVKAVYWNRCYEPWRIKRDTDIKKLLSDKGIEVKSHNSALLFEPHTTLKKDGTPYKVFKKGCLQNSAEPALPEATPKALNLYQSTSLSLDELELMPNIHWYKQMEEAWLPGEEGAVSCLETFLENGIKHYKEGRNFPAQKNVSRISPYLHFGEISPNKVWHAAKESMMTSRCENDGEHFLSELGWREFSNSLLYHFPDMPRKNLQSKFDAFPWQDDDEALSRWQKGQTGYPIIDAGMRELWQTGYMHNRVRMIVGSFLVKNLLLHWHHGEDWFWDTLVDADLANNSASWQWIAGCGADAAPYFRIFNPVTQGQKFDSDGEYVRQYVPEIANLPDKFIHTPWLASETILKEAKLELGVDYPMPIVDLKESRERALAAFKQISNINT